MSPEDSSGYDGVPKYSHIYKRSGYLHMCALVMHRWECVCFFISLNVSPNINALGWLQKLISAWPISTMEIYIYGIAACCESRTSSYISIPISPMIILTKPYSGSLMRFSCFLSLPSPSRDPACPVPPTDLSPSSSPPHLPPSPTLPFLPLPTEITSTISTWYSAKPLSSLTVYWKKETAPTHPFTSAGILTISISSMSARGVGIRPTWSILRVMSEFVLLGGLRAPSTRMNE